MNFGPSIHYALLISTRNYESDGTWFDSRWRGEVFRTRPDRRWGVPSLLYNENWGPFLGGYSGRSVTLSTLSHLTPVLKNV
jgi:hypothetical protein